MVDKILSGVILLLLAVVFLAPVPRPARADGFVILMMAATVLFLDDKWLKAFVGATLVSYLFAVRTPIAARTMVTLCISAMIIERLRFVKGRTLVLTVTGLMTVAVVYAAFYTAKFGIPMFVPLDNPVLAGPMYAIASPLAWTLSPILGSILAGAAILSKSTTAMICLLGGFSPMLWHHRKSLGGWAPIVLVQGIVATTFVLLIDLSHMFDARLQMIATTADLGRGKPFGYGLGSFIQIMPQELGRVLDGKLWGHAHNEVLQHFMESGWIPFIVSVTFILWHLSLYGKWRGPGERAVYGAMTASIVFVLLGFPFHFAPAAIMIAIVYSLHRRLIYG